MSGDNISGSGRSSSGNEGPATDRHNDPVVDPTKNVLDLVGAAIQRQDDLRMAQERLAEVKDAHLRETVVLRATERQAEIDNLTTLGRVEIDNLKVIEELRAAHAAELRAAEADRINAIRAVDNQAVQRAAEVSATQATTLATQVAQAAEAMRVQVAATATASATALANALEPITKAIEDLRRAQYEAQGKTTAVVDTSATNRSQLALIIAGISVFMTVIAVIATIIIQVVK